MKERGKISVTFREIVSAFQNAGIESAEWDAFLLVERFCHLSREQVLAEPERELSAPELSAAVERRTGRFPLQYLLGEWQFYRQTYRVTPGCLIPRADTEILVEEAIRKLPKGAFFADLCTGSGCIAISILCERPDTTAVALDLSDEALQIAAENAARNGVGDRLIFKKADLLTQAPSEWNADLPTPAALLSNPPYIRSDALCNLSPEVQAEPRMALDGGADGLLFYRKLLSVADTWIAPDGFCLFEIGFDQAEAVKKLAEPHFAVCRILRDYGGNDRVALLEKPN